MTPLRKTFATLLTRTDLKCVTHISLQYIQIQLINNAIMVHTVAPHSNYIIKVMSRWKAFGKGVFSTLCVIFSKALQLQIMCNETQFCHTF